MHDVLRLEAVNNSPIVEYRAIDGHPVPFQVTVQRRMLTPDGDEYLDGASEWRTVTVGEILDQLQQDSPVASWLRDKTRVDCRMSTLLGYSRSAPAYLPNVNADSGKG